ncbi:MAG: ribonuclease III [Oscillospiraceae bacterium]|nr:ribonuclease III [Oscillospiraceae bacterium]
MKGGVFILLEITEKKIEGNALNGLSLAFIGDAVYEIMVREHLLEHGSMPVKKLHTMAVEMVRASFQANVFDFLEPIVGEDENGILHRGRNASATHIPKGANAIEYRKATGVEALFGWLYLEGRNERIKELFEMILEHSKKEVSV